MKHCLCFIEKYSLNLNTYYMILSSIYSIMEMYIKVNTDFIDILKQNKIPFFAIKNKIYLTWKLKEELFDFVLENIERLCEIERLFSTYHHPALFVYDDELYINIRPIVSAFKKEKEKTETIPFLLQYTKKILWNVNVAKRKNIFIKEINRNLIFAPIPTVCSSEKTTIKLKTIKNNILNYYIQVYKKLKEKETTLPQEKLLMSFIKQQLQYSKSKT